MFYVYIIQSINFPDRHYTGFTKDIDSRLTKHNHGEVPYTSKYKPWKLSVYTAFEDKVKAQTFEKYLKSHSGRAFASKHF
jgi:predicted GIY-YIG superfamily endonuclease